MAVDHSFRVIKNWSKKYECEQLIVWHTIYSWTDWPKICFKFAFIFFLLAKVWILLDCAEKKLLIKQKIPNVSRSKRDLMESKFFFCKAFVDKVSNQSWQTLVAIDNITFINVLITFAIDFADQKLASHLMAWLFLISYANVMLHENVFHFRFSIINNFLQPLLYENKKIAFSEAKTKYRNANDLQRNHYLIF